MKSIAHLGSILILICFLYACHNNNNDSGNVSQFKTNITITQDTLSGSVNGTILSGRTVYFSNDIIIGVNDTLLLQSGVNLLAYGPNVNTSNPPKIINNGVFMTLGSQGSPNYITSVDVFKNPSMYKPLVASDPSSDIATQKIQQWGGIQSSSTAGIVQVRWTHLDYAGGINTSGTIPGYNINDPLSVIYFQNPNGYLIFEDSWIYGASTDAIKVLGAKLHVLRNTFEKVSVFNANAVNAVQNVVGDIAFNLFLGTANVSARVANEGGTIPATNVNVYNNTFVACGWRGSGTHVGAGALYEFGAYGLAYNNISAECKYGLKIAGGVDSAGFNMTQKINYGYSLNYVTTDTSAQQIYPVGGLVHPQTNDQPNPALWLDGFQDTYKYGGAYVPNPSITGTVDPKFSTSPFPWSYSIGWLNFVGNFSFHLQGSSTAIGVGYQQFNPLNSCRTIQRDVNFYLLLPTTSYPSADLGAFPTGSGGNNH